MWSLKGRETSYGFATSGLETVGKSLYLFKSPYLISPVRG